MIPGPRRPQCRTRSVEHIAGSLTEKPGRLRLDALRVEKVDLPATQVSALREHLAVHDRVGPRLIRRPALHGDVVREVKRPGSNRHRGNRPWQRRSQPVKRRGRRPQRRRPGLRDHPRGVIVVEMLGFVFDRRRRQAWLDQLDPPAIHHHIAGRRGDSHGPAKMMGDPNAHALKYRRSEPAAWIAMRILGLLRPVVSRRFWIRSPLRPASY